MMSNEPSDAQKGLVGEISEIPQASDGRIQLGALLGGAGGGGATDDLMEFRTTWLRAVAYAWANEEFAADLVKEGNATAALHQKFGFVWKWPTTLSLKVKKETEFKWIGDDWVWPEDKEDELVLYLPLKPKIPAEKHALALADYYHSRPSMFGRGPSPSASTVLSSSGVKIQDFFAEALQQFAKTKMMPGTKTAPLRISSREPPRDGFFPNHLSFLDFEVVLNSIMARAWENENFADMIVTKEHVGKAMDLIRGYKSPWKLHLMIRDDVHATWHDGGGDPRRSAWKDTTPHELTLNLPAAPKVGRDQTIALAAYNATGAEFPFTCCA